MVHLANLVRLLFSIYIILIFLRWVFTFLRPNLFNPLVRFVYSFTDPYLKLFAGLKFLRIGYIDFSPLLALYLLYLLQELTYRVILTGYISLELIVLLIVGLLFRFIYVVIFIFIVALGLRFIFEIAGFRGNNMLVTIIYSLSEPVVKPFRNLLRTRDTQGFDIHVLISLVILVLLRYFILPRILKILSMIIT